MAKLGIPGHKYHTRLGERVLVARDVEAVESNLVKVDTALAKLQSGGVVMVRSELAECLARWMDEMSRIAKRHGCGQIIASSAYRPLGTPCALGTPFADEGGALDSHDEWGHWSGWAIDVPTKYTRESFSPVLTIEECWEAARLAGLVRPFRSEYWHWRPSAEIIARAGENA